MLENHNVKIAKFLLKNRPAGVIGSLPSNNFLIIKDQLEGYLRSLGFIHLNVEVRNEETQHYIAQVRDSIVNHWHHDGNGPFKGSSSIPFIILWSNVIPTLVSIDQGRSIYNLEATNGSILLINNIECWHKIPPESVSCHHRLLAREVIYGDKD